MTSFDDDVKAKAGLNRRHPSKIIFSRVTTNVPELEETVEEENVNTSADQMNESDMLDDIPPEVAASTPTNRQLVGPDQHSSRKSRRQTSADFEAVVVNYLKSKKSDGENLHPQDEATMNLFKSLLPLFRQLSPGAVLEAQNCE